MRMNISTHVIVLPMEISDTRVDVFLSILDVINSNIKAIRLDLGKNKLISPAGYSIFMCILDAASEHNTKIELIGVDYRNEVHIKLDELVVKMQDTKGFLDIAKMNFILPTRINWSRISSIAPEFIKMIEDKFAEILTEDSLWNVQLIINELMQNVVDHSTSERYFLHAGINCNDFEFGVLDLGVSIPAKLEAKYREDYDHKYIEKSLVLEVGTRRNRKGGMGLYYLFENIKNEKGKLVIISRNGQVRRHFNARTVISKKTKYPLRGTWCFARIPLEKK